MFPHPLGLLSYSAARSGFSLHRPWSRVLQQTRGYGWWLDAVLEMLQEPTSTDLLFPWETICNTFKQCLTSANTSLSFNCWARQIKYKYISGGASPIETVAAPFRKLGFHIKSLRCAGNADGRFLRQLWGNYATQFSGSLHCDNIWWL